VEGSFSQEGKDSGGLHKALRYSHGVFFFTLKNTRCERALDAQSMALA
jgi:hypothetical protein